MASSEGDEAAATQKIEEAQKRLTELDEQRTKAIEKQEAAIKSKGEISKSTVGSEESRAKRITKLDEMEARGKEQVIQIDKKSAAQKGIITKENKKLLKAQQN
jgi:hypothetical protein